jgi:hypothetical protein
LGGGGDNGISILRSAMHALLQKCSKGELEENCEKSVSIFGNAVDV